MKRSIVFFVLTTVILAITISFYWDKILPKTGYILIQEVYNNFEYKVELEKKFIDIKGKRQKILDSLETRVNILGNKIRLQVVEDRNNNDIAEFTTIREEFLNKKRKIEEENNALSKQFDAKILSQLNQYIKEFGKEFNYTYIFGNDGNGSLLYADDRRNISKEVSDYLNTKFKTEKLK